MPSTCASAASCRKHTQKTTHNGSPDDELCEESDGHDQKTLCIEALLAGCSICVGSCSQLGREEQGGGQIEMNPM